MTSFIDTLRAPLLVTWQITRDCDLCCLHCCTDSAPGKRLADELDRDTAVKLAGELVRSDVPYVMLCGGEPLVCPHFFDIAEVLGRGGVQIKMETNGQRFDASVARRLAPLPVRSVQISLDGDSPDVYRRQRPGGSLEKAHAACRAVREAGLPLEVTFAPSRLNLHEAGAVIERARALGAFRFNSGKLMRIGTAARQWKTLEPTAEAYVAFRNLLDAESAKGGMEICRDPFSMGDALRESASEPPATLLVLPNGRVKVAAALPHLCADLRRDTLAQAWDAYRAAWRSDTIRSAVRLAADDESRHADANAWQIMPVACA